MGRLDVRSAFLSISLSAAAVLMLAAPGAGAQERNCAGDAIEEAAKQVDKARAALLALPVPGELDTAVSGEAKTGIALLKKRLGDLAAAYMNCAGGETAAGDVGRGLNASLDASVARGRAAAKGELSGAPLHGYARRLAFRAARPAGVAGLMAVTATFDIRCGEDAVLFVFALENGGWKEALRWQSPAYDEVSGAFWRFGYSIAPADAHGGWYVVVKSVSPWCTSNWRGTRYWALRPVPGAAQPKEILAGRAAIFLDGEEYGRLSAWAGG